jgi:hypothetical protein
MGGLCSQGWGVGIFDRGLRLADIEYVTLASEPSTLGTLR